MGSKGSRQTSQAYTPNAGVGQSGSQALTMAQGAAGLPFQQQVAPVASFSDDQLSAFADMRRNQGAALPFINAGAGYLAQSANPISESEVSNYFNPFSSFVTSGMERLFGQQRRDTTGRLTAAAGGTGADRIALGQGNLAREQGQSYGQTLAGIYGQAQQAAQQDKQRQQATGFGLGQLGPALQNSLMTGTQGLFNFGGIQQQQKQAELNAPYQWDLARIAHQYQIPQWLSQLTAQTAPALGGTTTNTYPAPSPWGTIAGLGMAGVGAYMGNPGMVAGGLGGLFGGQAPQTGGMTASGWGNTGGGYNPNVPGGYVFPSFAARGGAVGVGNAFQAFEDGGDVPGIDWNLQPQDSPPEVAEALRTGAPLPESAWLPPSPPPAPPTVPQGQPALPPIMRIDDSEGMPPEAMGYAPMGPGNAGAPSSAAAPPWLRNSASFPPSQQQPQVRPAAPLPPLPEIPPDPGEGSFARSPWLALMNAGLATMAAAGERDRHGLPLSPLAAVGKGGQEGVKTLKVQDQLGTQRRRVQLEAQRLLEAARHHRETLDEQRRFHDLTDAERRDRLRETIAERWARQQDAERDRRERRDIRRDEQQIKALQPIPLGPDPLFGQMRYGVRDPRNPTRMLVIDPSTGRLMTPEEANDPLAPGSVPSQQQPPTQPIPDGASPTGPQPGPTFPDPPSPSNEVPAGPQPAPPPQGEDVLPPGAQPTQAATSPAPPPDNLGEDVRPHVRPDVLEYLQRHNPGFANQVKAVAEGRMPVPAGAGLRSPQSQRLLYWVSQYDPSFDAVNYNARQRTRSDFGAGKMANGIRSLNTSINHLSAFEKTIDRLNNSNYPTYNKFANWLAEEAGDVQTQRARGAFHAARTALTEELTRAFRESGGNVHDIKNWEKALSDADSPAKLRESVKTIIELLRGRLSSMTDQYNQGMGTTRDPITWISPAGRETLERIERKIEESERPPPRRIGRAKAEGAAPKGPSEGQKKTVGGVEYTFRDGQWTSD